MAWINLARVREKLIDDDLKTSVNHPQVAEVMKLYHQITCFIEDPRALYKYAKFLSRCGRIQQAESRFLSLLSTNPQNISNVVSYYIKFLLCVGLPDEAEFVKNLFLK